jgi:hypothetical protein
MQQHHEDYRVTLTLNPAQARVVMRALDLYSRLKMGQFDEIVSLFGFHREFDRDHARLLLRDLHTTVFPELHGNEYYGIFHEQAGDGREAWDIYQTIRHAVAWHREPEGGITVDFDRPLKSSAEPLPVVTIEKP